MRMFFKVPAALMLAVAMCLCCASRSIAQDKKDDKGGMSGHDMNGMQMPNKDDMDKMMKAAMPGPQHQEMMKSAGDWDAECHFIMNGQPGPAMKATMHMEPIFDGRFMMMKYDGVMNMGGADMPFKGMGLMGFDNTTQKYFNVWIDTMSTSMMKTEGTKEGNTVTLTGKMTDPATGKEVPVKEVVSHADDSHMHYEMFAPGPDGKEAKMMEIDYTKKM